MKAIFACFFICLFYANGIDGLLEHWNGEHEPGTADIITSIPTLNQMPEAEMFAGYLSPSSDPSSPKRLYYWLNRSQDPESKTLVLWLNGGPGCSSLLGLFKEHGPLKFDPQTGNLTEREHSWNKFAHTLYIEAPVGTGYSYGDEGAILNDRATVTDIVGAIHDFLQNHPRYIDFDIYLAGQSYAGVYIPLVAERLIKNADAWGTTLNFKGIILGNPLLNKALEDATFREFAYHHGLVSKETYDFWNSHKCNNIAVLVKYDTDTMIRCNVERNRISRYRTPSSSPIDIYDISRDCWNVDQDFLYELKLSQHSYEEESATAEQRKEMEENSKLLNLAKQNPVCSEWGTEKMESFLSDKDVQKALNAKYWVPREFEFKVCSGWIRNKYNVRFRDMSPRIKALVTNHNKTVLLYYGDQDGVCNFLSGQEFVSGLKLEKTSPYEPYVFAEGNGLVERVAGYSKVYADRLKYATVKGAGHMAPRDKPEATFKLVSEWIASHRDT